MSRGTWEELGPLTDEELKAIRALRRLAKQWPPSLWLWSAGGCLHVMRHGSDGTPVMTSAGADGGVDRRWSVESINGIQNDGGDW